MSKLALLFTAWFMPYLCHCQDLEKQLQKIGEKHSLVGMSVVIVKNGTILNSFQYGFRDMQRSLPVDSNTTYRIASISKVFTVTALMQLYEKGLFRLNDDVSDYLGFKLRNPNFPEKPITFSMLMSHTSSIRDGASYDNFLMASYQKKPFPSIESVIKPGGEFFTEDMWSKTDGPGSGYFQYVNLNFGLLGTLVEKISGERFDKYCIEHLFKPLQISGRFDVRDLDNINNLAVIYRKVDGAWVAQNDDRKGVKPPDRDLSDYKVGSNAVIFAPQGGLRISANDLAKFMMLHQNMGIYNGVRLLADTTARRMHEVVWKYNGSNGDSEKDFYTAYALGCKRTDKLIPGVELIGHSGDAYGLISGMYYSEKEDFGIIFITNGGEWKAGIYSGSLNVEEDIFMTCYKYLKKL